MELLTVNGSETINPNPSLFAFHTSVHFSVVCSVSLISGSKGLGTGAIVGIAIGSIVGLLLLILLVFFGARAYRNRKEQYDSETVYRPLTTPIAEMPMGSKS